MHLFTFAISSIVDANTGYGLYGSKHPIEIGTAARHGRKFRSTSIQRLLASFKNAISRRIETYRVRAQERRDLAELLAMNDRLLEDIGLSRGDLIAVELGSISLQQLQAERRGRRGSEHAVVSTAKLGQAADIEQEAANEASYRERSCA